MRSIQAWRALASPAPQPERFRGLVLFHTLTETDDPSDLEILAVFFDAGARTLPHAHATAQLLYFLEGEGIVGTEEERTLFRAGQMAFIPPGEWHWRGGTPATAACHLSIRPGGPTSWPPEVPILDWETYTAGAGTSP